MGLPDFLKAAPIAYMIWQEALAVKLEDGRWKTGF